MKLIPANQASEEKLECFFQSNPEVKTDLLLQIGYIVELNDKIEGCFVLDSFDDEIYWLKQLYVTKNAAALLPVLVESVLALAKKQEAREVFVHSHQPMVDVLLESLQFYPQKDSVLVDKYPAKSGNWWSYQVS
ncbi:hypothetical protein ACFO3D_07685 [Virgibacillus kekensis]|uniref:N-acetyltransferase domain-containing protein n=1 Tax=Virgibacillus kekensis TaxID=202261 RepID=A0ABV9DGX1_9BACI